QETSAPATNSFLRFLNEFSDFNSSFIAYVPWMKFQLFHSTKLLCKSLPQSAKFQRLLTILLIPSLRLEH
ncbi:MAG: hypothetical protein QGI15_05195, partial [Candidatus Scalindua sp.]|nr:hypothetical protein [Candidatus Scalindua sp.]